MKRKKDKQAVNGVVISLSPIMYVYLEDPVRYDKAVIGMNCCAAGDGHVVMSAGYFHEQLNQAREDGEAIPEELLEVERAIKAVNFDGDVWFYTN